MHEAVASGAITKLPGSLRYEVEVVGDCLGDWIPNGSQLVADISEEVRPLRLVNITIREGDGPWSSWMRETGETSVCKIFLGRITGAVLVGQLKPPVVGIIPENDIQAMHPVVGAIGGMMAMTKRDKAALALVAPLSLFHAPPKPHSAKPKRKQGQSYADADKSIPGAGNKGSRKAAKRS